MSQKYHYAESLYTECRGAKNIIQANHFSEHVLLPKLPGTAFTASLFFKGLLNALHLAVLLWLHYQYRRAPAYN